MFLLSLILFALGIVSFSSMAANIDIEQIPDLPIKNIPTITAPSDADKKSGVWQISLGGGMSYAPSYEGAASNRLRFVPLLDASYNNGKFFISPLRGIGYNFSEDKDVQYGIRLSIGHGRDQSVDPHLYGMGNINYVPEAGLFFNQRVGALYISSGISSGSNGSHAELGTGVGFPLSVDDRLRLGVNLNWGDNRYSQTYFGVTQLQATASGGELVAYDANAGITEYALTSNWVHNYGKKWFGNAGLSFKQISGAALQSPLTQRSSTSSVNYLLGYRF
jgi:outer membrane protein